MITIKGQVCVQFSIGPFTDFISADDFEAFVIRINCGGLRPILEASFTVTSPNIIPYINKGNIITVCFGINEITSSPMQFEIEGIGETKLYRYGVHYQIIASMYNPTFTSNVKSDNYSFNNKKSYEALKILADKNGFDFITNVTKTDDAQNWTQDGKSDWMFLQEIAERAYINTDTFFAYGFDCNNIYFYNMREQIKAGPKWVFSVGSAGREHPNSTIVNIGSYSSNDENMGTMAKIAGNNVTTVGYNMDTGEMSKPTYKLKTFTTMDTDKLNMNPTDCQQYEYKYLTGDMHPNTIIATNQNLRNNALFSSHEVLVPIGGQYRDYRLLDIVQLIPFDTDKSMEGIYIISGIAYQYDNQRFQTNVLLNRESTNGLIGANLKTGE